MTALRAENAPRSENAPYSAGFSDRRIYIIYIDPSAQAEGRPCCMLNARSA
jgi:hypothetical protein